MQEWEFLGVTFVSRWFKILLHSEFSEKKLNFEGLQTYEKHNFSFDNDIKPSESWDFICTLNNNMFKQSSVYTAKFALLICKVFNSLSTIIP